MRWDFGSSGGTGNFRHGKFSEKRLTLFRWRNRARLQAARLRRGDIPPAWPRPVLPASSQHRSIRRCHPKIRNGIAGVVAAATFLVAHLYIGKMSMRIPTTNHASQAFVLWTSPL